MRIQTWHTIRVVDIFKILLDKHAPVKIKKVRRNQSRFMNKGLSKAIMKRSSLKSKYLKNKNNINRNNYKNKGIFASN